jgi:hypothetical protein
MTGKQMLMGDKPARDPNAELWIKGGAEGGDATNPWTARLTIDVTPALRGRIKIIAFERGTTVAEMLRGLLEAEFGTPGEARG